MASSVQLNAIGVAVALCGYYFSPSIFAVKVKQADDWLRHNPPQQTVARKSNARKEAPKKATPSPMKQGEETAKKAEELPERESGTESDMSQILEQARDEKPSSMLDGVASAAAQETEIGAEEQPKEQSSIFQSKDDKAPNKNGVDPEATATSEQKKQIGMTENLAQGHEAKSSFEQVAPGRDPGASGPAPEPTNEIGTVEGEEVQAENKIPRTPERLAQLSQGLESTEPEDGQCSKGCIFEGSCVCSSEACSDPENPQDLAAFKTNCQNALCSFKSDIQCGAVCLPSLIWSMTRDCTPQLG